MKEPKPKPCRHTQAEAEDKAGRQAGSISQHRGYWRIRYRQQLNINGKIVTVQRSRNIISVDECPSESEARKRAEKELKEVLDEANHPQPVSKGEAPMLMSLGRFVDEIYFAQAQLQNRPSTLRGYRQTWNNYLKDRAGAMMLREVETKHVQGWLNQLAAENRVHSRNTRDVKKLAKLETHRLTKTTLGHIKHFVSGVFRFAATQGYLDGTKAEMVTLAKIPANAPRGKQTHAYSLEEIEAMVKVMDGADPTLLSGTIITCAAFTALRQGELTGLLWECYKSPSHTKGNEALGEIFVGSSVWRGYRTKPKSEASEAPVPVIPRLAKRLAEHRKRLGNPDKGPVFPNGAGNPLDLNWLVTTKLRPALEEAGIDWRGWHAFRRGLATNLDRLGIGLKMIQLILRHANADVTLKHYIKPSQEDKHRTMREFADSLKSATTSMRLRKTSGKRTNGAPAQGSARRQAARPGKTVIAPLNSGFPVTHGVTQNRLKSGAKSSSLIQ